MTPYGTIKAGPQRGGMGSVSFGGPVSECMLPLGIEILYKLDLVLPAPCSQK